MTARTLNQQIDDIVALAQANNHPLDRATLFVLSGAAFRTYVFSPEDNYAWTSTYPDRPFHPDDVLVDNYGVMETVTGHFDLHPRPYLLKKAAELVALYRHESDQGRSLLLQHARGGPGSLIRSLNASRSGITLELQRNDEHLKLEHDDLGTADEFVSSLGVVLTLRPPGERSGDVPFSRRNALTRDALCWAMQHYYARREIAHHLELYFASGQRAWDVLGTQLETLLRDKQRSEVSAAFRSHARTLIAALADARAQAHAFFSRTDDIPKHLDVGKLGGEQFEELAAQAKRSSTELDTLASRIADLSAEEAADAVRHVAATEQTLFATLESIARTLEPHREFRSLFF